MQRVYTKHGYEVHYIDINELTSYNTRRVNENVKAFVKSRFHVKNTDIWITEGDLNAYRNKHKTDCNVSDNINIRKLW